MNHKKKDYFENRIQRWVSTFFTNVGTILLFGACGYIIDYYFGTTPWALIVLLVISFPVSIAIQIYKIKKI